jgi:hypothetical protein
MDYVTYLAIAFIIVGVVLVVLSLNQRIGIAFLVGGVGMVVLPPVIIAFLRWRSSPRTEGPVEGSTAGVFYAEQRRAGLSNDAVSRAYVGQRLGGLTQDEALRTYAGSASARQRIIS